MRFTGCKSFLTVVSGIFLQGQFWFRTGLVFGHVQFSATLGLVVGHVQFSAIFVGGVVFGRQPFFGISLG